MKPAKHDAAITLYAKWAEHHVVWLLITLIMIGTLRIVATYPVFSYTIDEPAHIACGMEWLDNHTYRYEPQHPPLARVMTALLPWLSGSHGWQELDFNAEGLAILSKQGHLDRTLTLSRIGILPFFWLTCWATFLWTIWLTGSRCAALLAVFLLTMTPAILAHSGLATTDMGLTAMFMLAVYAGWRWVETPNMRRTIWFGIGLGGAILVKFSTLAFLPMVGIFALLGRFWFERPTILEIRRQTGSRIAQLFLIGAIAALMIWAAFFFSFGSAPFVSFPVPAPELLKGIKQVMDHNSSGHITYLMGETSIKGWPWYFVIALGLRTPIPILILALAGLWLLRSPRNFGVRAWVIPSIVLGVLTYASLFSQIQIGTRHVMPVYVAFAIAGACASLWLLRHFSSQKWPLYTIAVALICTVVSSAAAHPDYLSYYNFLAGKHPEHILVEDLEWGQDMKRLGLRLRELGAMEVAFDQPIAANMEQLYGFPPIRPLDVNGPRPGWNAVNVLHLKLGLFGNTFYSHDSSSQFWPELMPPTERVGHGILLFYNPASQ